MTTSQISDGSQAVQDLFSDADYVAKQLYQVRGCGRRSRWAGCGPRRCGTQ